MELSKFEMGHEQDLLWTHQEQSGLRRNYPRTRTPTIFDSHEGSIASFQIHQVSVLHSRDQNDFIREII